VIDGDDPHRIDVDWKKYEPFTTIGTFPPASKNVDTDLRITPFLLPSDYSAIMHDKQHTYVFGKMIYCDVFKREHWFTWCYHLLSGGGWAMCGNTNEIDNQDQPTKCPVTAP
jgi:hypothetical protein